MELSLQLSQKQILSQRMQQSVEILQMNTTTLSECVREWMEENPVLDWKEAEPVAQEKNDKLREKLEWLEAADEQNRGYYKVEHEKENESDDWKYGKKTKRTLRESLLFQIHMLPSGQKERSVLSFLAESTDAGGYLEEADLEAAKEKYHLSQAEMERILERFQTLEPVGVGARNLKECLLIQLRAKGASALAIRMAEEYLEELGKNRLQAVAKQLHVKLCEAAEAFQEIKTCSPKPGSGFDESADTGYILPDILVEKRNGELNVSLNSGYIPQLFVSPYYLGLLKSDAQEEAKDYIKHKVGQAQWLIQCIHSRENTLLRTAEVIVSLQQPFFLEKDGAVRPMRLVDVAEMLQVHESTVSRAINGKYLQCCRGVYPLQYFFSKALASGEEEAVSAKQTQQQLRKMIEQEDKKDPLSDRALAEALQQQGIRISRRTVAKYRQAMQILGAAGRKEF